MRKYNCGDTNENNQFYLIYTSSDKTFKDTVLNLTRSATRGGATVLPFTSKDLKEIIMIVDNFLITCK